MESQVYINHLKNSYRTSIGDRYVAINRTSCYFINEITSDLIDILPMEGTKKSFLDFLREKGIIESDKVLEKMISTGMLTRKETLTFKKVLLKMLSPEIPLMNPFILEKLFRKIGQPVIKDDFKKVLIVFLTLFFASNAVFILDNGINLSGNGYILLPLILVGSLIHELGHSFMMYINGLGARNIGLFFYLIYPSFYVNMSGIERLKILDRLISNTGGFIFQSAYCLFLLLFYFLTGKEIFLDVYLISCLLMLFNLNPFIRSDGYWLYMDFIAVKKNHGMWSAVNRIYLFASFLFTLYFSWHLITSVFSALIGSYFSLKTSFGFKNIIMAYLGIISIKALVRKIKEFLNDFEIIKKDESLKSETV